MKQAEYRQLSPRLASLVFVGLLIHTTAAEQFTSQTTDRNSTLMRYYCSKYKAMNGKYFLNNLNSTLTSLRHQLATSGFATAPTLLNGDPVWGLAWCRGYVSIPDCLSCFDYAVQQLKSCGLGGGAHAIYSDCNVRYESNNFYTEANNRAGIVLCDNKTLPEQIEFRKETQKLLLDIQVAAPRASKYYAASTREVAAGNGTVYAIAQCNLNVSRSVCSECLRLRSDSLYDCVPAISGRAMDNGCFMRYDRNPFFGPNQTTDISSLTSDGDSSKKRLIIGSILGGVSFLFLLFALLLWCQISKKVIDGGLEDKSTGLTELLQGPTIYNYNDIKHATNNFSDENKLGGGMFSEVYKGTLENGDMIAITKSFFPSNRGNTHFDDELKIISNVHHRHLVRFLGYCSKGPHLFLVHEYVENHSLDQFLHGDKTSTLSWKQRFGIIFGTARGLAYLHEQYHVTIIHRDIKTSNILLDKEFQPKIADFGLVRLLPEDKTHLNTKLARSLNNGFVAPEYANYGHLSEKVDTYSYGVVVLEIISGKQCKGETCNISSIPDLLNHAWNLYESGTHLNLIDDRLDPSEYEIEDVLKIIEIALMCTQPTVSAIPTMSEVVILLSDQSVAESSAIRSTIRNGELKIQVA